MKVIQFLVIVTGLLFVTTGCSTPTPDTNVDSLTDANNAYVEKTLFIGPERVECVGVAPQECYKVKDNPTDEWRLFYSQIIGFEYEPGYEYELIVREEKVENPPADGSSLRWTLIEVVNKKAAE